MKKEIGKIMLTTLKKLCERCASVVSFVTKYLFVVERSGHKVYEVCTKDIRNTMVELKLLINYEEKDRQSQSRQKRRWQFHLLS